MQPFDLGYNIFGPVLFSYIRWIQEEVKKNDIEEVIFLARDGYIVNKAMNILEEETCDRYRYVSRQSVIVPYIQYCSTMNELIDLYKSWPKEITLTKLFKRYGIELEQFKDILIKEHINENLVIDEKELFNNKLLEKLFLSLKTILYTESKVQEKLLLEYLEQDLNHQSLGLVDLGGKATIQRALIKLLEKNNIKTRLFGLYFSSENKSAKLYNSILNQSDFNNLQRLAFRLSYMWLEIFFSAPHGSTLRYEIKDNHVFPVKEEEMFSVIKSEDNLKLIESIQDGALSYVSSNKDKLNFDLEASIDTLTKFMLYPPDCESSFKDLKFDGDCILELYKWCGWKVYLLNWRQLKADFDASLWKAAFLKKLFNLDLVLYVFYKLILLFMKYKNGK